MIVAHLFNYVYWVWVASEALLQILTRTSSSSGQIKDRGSLIVLVAAIFASVWGALEYGATHPHTIPGGITVLTAALVLFAAGLVVRWVAIATLGFSFSTNVAIHVTQRLRTTGLYRWVRHPSYAGMLLIFAAVGLGQRNWISLAIMLVFPIAALLYRIHVEERALTEAFGGEYARYCTATRRLFPGVY